MSRSNPASRYDIRKDGPNTWEIFDTTTGRTVTVGTVPMARLKLDAGEVLVNRVNSGAMPPDEETLH